MIDLTQVSTATTTCLAALMAIAIFHQFAIAAEFHRQRKKAARRADEQRQDRQLANLAARSEADREAVIRLKQLMEDSRRNREAVDVNEESEEDLDAVWGSRWN